MSPVLPPPPNGIPMPRSVGLPPPLGETEPPEFEHKNLAAEPSSATIPSCRALTGQGQREAGLEPMATLALPKAWRTTREPVKSAAGPGIPTKTHLTRRMGYESAPTSSDASDRPPAARTTKNGSTYRQNPRPRPPALVQRHPRCRKQWGWASEAGSWAQRDPSKQSRVALNCKVFGLGLDIIRP